MMKQAQPNTLTWLTICLLAALIGYNLGQLQLAGNTGTTTVNQHTVGPSSLNNDHTVSNIASEAANWVVSVETFTARTQHSSGTDPTLEVPNNQKSLSAGIIYNRDGYIVTSNHAIGIDHDIEVVLPNKQRVPAKLVGRDFNSDVAVLKIDAPEIQAARFGNNTATRSGDWAISIGNPMRLDNSVSLGIISALNRIIEGGPVAGVDLIQTDAAINLGSSGGPLLNINGEVIGMNAVVQRDAQSIGFAIPIETVRQVASDIIEYGAVQRGYLGLCIGSSGSQPNEDHNGAVVIYAVKNSPATKSGIRASDVIVAADGVAIKRPSELNRFLAFNKPGKTVVVDVVRGNEKLKMRVLLGAIPPEEEAEATRTHARPK